MKILITGATGFLGNTLLKELKNLGYELNVLTRNFDTAPAHLPVHCNLFYWDPETRAVSPDALEGVTAVINLAGENIADSWWTEKKKRKIIESRINTIKTLNKLFETSNSKPNVFISASAIGFYGDRDEKILDEDSDHGCGFLSEVCQSWENEIFKMNQFGIRTVAFRIGMVLGHGGGALEKILPPFKLGFGGNLGSGKQWMSWIHINDLVNMMIKAITTNSIKGAVNAVSPNPVINKNFTSILSRVLQMPAFLPVPKILLKLGLKDLSDLLLNSQRVIPNKITKCGFKFKYPILDDALREICSHKYNEIEIEQLIPANKDKVFEFFKEAKNLEIITPKFLKFKVMSQSTPTIKEGTIFNYFLFLRIIPMWWKSKIIDWKPNSKFSDLQVRGPYNYWFHTHEFKEINLGTLMRDRVRYRIPFGVLGDVILKPFIKKDIEKIFNHRKKVIEKFF